MTKLRALNIRQSYADGASKRGPAGGAPLRTVTKGGLLTFWMTGRKAPRPLAAAMREVVARRANMVENLVVQQNQRKGGA